MTGIIFVGGIHGVGKTTLCKQISEQFKLLHYSASDLISQRKKVDFNNEKKVRNINENQNLLLEAINCLDTRDNCLLLDGHFCLINTFGEIRKIPIETFINLSPSAIICCTESPTKIFTRLKERDNINYDINFLERYQRIELAYSQEISEKLNVPYFVYSPVEEMNNFYKFLERIIKGGVECE
ncbi:MAG: AAA family ATPase [Bacillaceae bacterium]|nr:AAA family ATPase [Bacillaceae bacterium]